MNAKTKLAQATQQITERQFYSIDGTDIRVTHPDGSVAIVNVPRTLPRKLWRAAVTAGCQVVADNAQVAAIVEGQANSAKALAELTPADEAAQRATAIYNAVLEAYESDEADQAYADAFTNSGVPNVRWLENKLGFSISATERDKAWAEVQEQDEGAGDGDGEGDEGDDE